MSRAFEVFRRIQEEASANLAAQTSAAKKDEPNEPWSLREEFSSLAARLEATGAHLEGLIADAERVRKGWEEDLLSSQSRIQEASLEALRAAVATTKAETFEEIKSFSQRSLNEIQKRTEEKARAATDAIEKMAEVAAVKTGSASNSAYAELQHGIDEMKDRFRNDLKAISRTSQAAISRELEQKADSLAELASMLIQRQVEDSLELFSETLLISRKSFVGLIEKETDNAKETIQTMTTRLKTELEHELNDQWDVTFQNLQDQSDGLISEAKSQITTHTDKASAEGCGILSERVDQAVLRLSESQEKARRRLESDFQRSLEYFAKQITDLSSTVIEQQRQKVGLLLSDLHTRFLGIARSFEEARSGFQQIEGGNGETPNIGDNIEHSLPNRA
jgi:hypothetical protein